jgi:hydrogenase maturation protein HypF
MPRRKKIRIRGIVQGVGFRPFVYRLARCLRLRGFVRNTTNGVEIEMEGKSADIERFLERVRSDAPPAARIDGIINERPTRVKYDGFSIRESKASRGFTQISPDIATCPDCLHEMYDPADRRYRFPFINCTNCGPRYSIITGTPYDRVRTSMRAFRMCPDCAQEFGSIDDRRFHAQPNCCMACGPVYELHAIDGRPINASEPIEKAAALLNKGKIVAVKGIGGFHIACDATNCSAVRSLRRSKHRPTKPFAIMTEEKNLAQIAHLNSAERAMMRSPVAPIMLLRKRAAIICEAVSPNNPYLGVMLPYTPVHYLLLEKTPFLVMTSANLRDEPLVKDTQEVKEKLGSLVSFYLDHNRAVENRCDDSVGYHLPRKGFSIIRRSRGYAPVPIELPIHVKPTLAVGPLLKNTFTLANGREAYVSPHIGDLDNLQTLNFFDEMVRKYQTWFRITPQIVVHDMHPDYMSTKLARKTYGTKVSVQHHIAHFASCLGENNVAETAIGIIFDGTGYGLDGKIWGGEFFVGNLQHQERAGHLQYLPLPGGESSIRKPYRIAIAYARYLLDEDLKIASGPERRIIMKMIGDQRNFTYTSSMGRLFDCVSATLGITRAITYEAEAAINLEYTAATRVRSHYPYKIIETDPFVIEVRDTLAAILVDKRKGVSNSTISAKFHNTIVEFSLAVATMLKRKYGTQHVCFSGGVFQNRYLLNLMIERFEKARFYVHVHRKLPNNDGCISYGQTIVGNEKYRT